MAVDEIRALLDKWQERMIEANTRMDALSKMLMASPESDFMRAMHALMDGYTEAIAQLVQDDCQWWLSWWWMDCAFGTAGSRSITLNYGKDARTINNTTDLAQLLFDCANET
jgi:hypothetical protein